MSGCRHYQSRVNEEALGRGRFGRIIENELALQQQPEFRRDRAAVRALLDPDCIEVDRTGRVWALEPLIEALATQTGYMVPQNSEPVAATVGPGVQLLTYRDERTFHSSVWVKDASDAWRLRFHQQTPINE
jgi:hypothetical protein